MTSNDNPGMATPACASRSRLRLRARVSTPRVDSATIAACAACTARVVVDLVLLQICRLYLEANNGENVLRTTSRTRARCGFGRRQRRWPAAPPRGAPFAPYRAASRRAGRRSSRAVARRAVEDAEKPDTTRTQDAAASAVVEEQATSGEIVRLLGVTLSRYTGSGAAMLRNGGAAVRHHAAVARGDTDAVTRPLSWSPLMTLGVELLSGFLEGIAIEDAEVAALRPRDDGETSDSKSAERLLTYLRSLRAMMAVGVPPLPGTRVQRVTVDDVPAVWLTPNARSWNSSGRLGACCCGSTAARSCCATPPRTRGSCRLWASPATRAC